MVILKRKLAGVTEAALARFVSKACKAVRLGGPVDVLVTSSAEMRELNRQFRRKDKPTDVLSFPSAVEELGGDIAISADIAAANGEELGHGAVAELKILILHGVLHLAGLDHEKDSGEMAERERSLRAKLGLPDGLIERSLPSRPARKRMKSRTAGATARKGSRRPKR